MSDPDLIRVLLVDDQELVRTGFRLVLKTTPDITVVGEAASGRSALEALQAGLEADVICMDVRMPDMDGIEATKAIVEAGIPSRILVLTTFDLDEYVYDALAAGASGFLLKECGSADLIAGIRAVHAGNAILAPTATARLLQRFQPHLAESDPGRRRRGLVEMLTARELDVLTAIGQGLTNQEISQRLFLAETTVKSHVGHLLTKLEVRDRIQLVILAYDTGLVVPKI